MGVGLALRATAKLGQSRHEAPCTEWALFTPKRVPDRSGPLSSGQPFLAEPKSAAAWVMRVPHIMVGRAQIGSDNSHSVAAIHESVDRNDFVDYAPCDAPPC